MESGYGSSARIPNAQFMARVREQDDGCWKWVGTLKRSPFGSYGAFTLRGEGMGAHRASWMLFRGPIPDGLTIDHLCENTRCVNPAHLEPVTLRENILRASRGTAAINAHKTECIRGHAFDEANTIIHCGGKRACRTCVNDAQVRNRLKRLGRAV